MSKKPKLFFAGLFSFVVVVVVFLVHIHDIIIFTDRKLETHFH